MPAKFILSKEKVLKQYDELEKLGFKISYSFKTNKEVGKILEDNTRSEFSVHEINEIEILKDKTRIWFFPQAWNINEIKKILEKGVENFVLDNELDLNNLIDIISKEKIKVNILLRMKLNEHRVSSGRYYVYGFSSKRTNELILKLSENKNIENLGIHVHRKSQNTSEWNILKDLQDSISREVLEKISIINLGGGLPVKYKTYPTDMMKYIFEKIEEIKSWLSEKNIQIYIEPGRFIAAPSIKLETEIIQIQENTIVINTSIYNCALDTMITNIRMLVENELDEKSEQGNFYLIKGNTPTRDDIFRYKVKLKNPKVGDKITFLNAGAYNYTTDFCNLTKLRTEII
jgi:ornithine decarboxylase